MAKILLVEDDNNLREIYEARLQAEGYTIVSAMDGEAALVVAKQEKPDLVISDVMMPRISGFEMLDILRNTEGLRDVKVIMLTALGQAEDKTRADSLGADRYLVKSQVTLEDIVKAAHELLGNDEAPIAPQATAAAAEQAAAMAAASAPQTVTVGQTPMPQAVPAPVAMQTNTPSAAPVVVVTPPATQTPSIPVQPAPTAPPATSNPSETTPASPPVASQTPATTNDQTASLHSPTPPTVPATQPSQAPTSSQPVTSLTPLEPAAPEPATPQAPSAPDDAMARSSSTPLPGLTEQPVVPPSQPAAPSDQVTPSNSHMPAAQTSSEEEAAIKAQIENFVNQNDQTAPRPVSASEAVMADAIKDLVSNTTATPQVPAPPKVITPPGTTPLQTPFASADQASEPQNAAQQPVSPVPGQQGVAAQSLGADQSGTPASPQTSSATSTPGATNAASQTQTAPRPVEDGVTVGHKKVIAPITDPAATQPLDLDELLKKEGIANFDDDHPAPAQGTGAMPPANPALPSQPSLPTTPHPPGHVISPNNGVDPNTIAL